jgi:hypothetical protein
MVAAAIIVVSARREIRQHGGSGARRAIPSFRSLRARLRCIIISLAQRAASSPGRQPGVNAGSVESMTTCQAAHVVVVLKSIDADGAGIARRS